MGSEGSPCFHALVLPFPAQGHINPLLRFSRLLLLHSPQSLITFVNTEPNHLPCVVKSPPSSNIRFLSIPHGLPPHAPPSFDTSMETFFLYLDCMKKQQGLIENIIRASMSSSSPISCIISDTFLPWTQQLANRLHIKRVNFWTLNATTMYMQQLLITHRLVLEESGQYVVKVTKKPSEEDPVVSLVHSEIAPQYIAARKPEGLRFMEETYEGVEDAVCIVICTSHGLEGPILRAMPLNVPVRCIPLTARSEAEEESEEGKQSECVRWLDKQKKSSVLYISFGSVVQQSTEQIEEIALGIEASGQPFVWVVRHESRSAAKTQVVVEEFVKRTKERGMVIEWAPQRRVLGHPAVGGFLTHCGWNSTLESITMGIPMLCWPMSFEQPVNSELIQKVWKVGMGFGTGKRGVVDRKEVEKMVTCLLQGEEGKALRVRAVEMRNEVLKGAAEDLEAFFQDVSN